MISLRTIRTAHSGQTIVEFALASLVFLTIIFGTIDFGRAIFIRAELVNAAREGARYGKINPTQTTAIRAATVDHAPGSGLTSSSVSVSCTGRCATGNSLTVVASVPFQAVTQQLLGIGPLTLTGSATVNIE
ncbi:MAG: pilus assembly protein [Chloroflexota bacterium]|jgi:Flp pilus assembly protein TadG|nr:pilus assembly protein [Chloroflexota bacterium]